MSKKRKYKSEPPRQQVQMRQQNQLLNILMLAFMAVALAIGDWLTTAQNSPWYFIGAVIVGAAVFLAVRRYNSRPL